MDPRVHEPIAPMQSPAATAAAEPVLEPPVDRAVFQGFRETGKPALGSGPPTANSFMASFPSSMAPADVKRAATVESTVGTLSALTLDPAVVRTPAVS